MLQLSPTRQAVTFVVIVLAVATGLALVVPSSASEARVIPYMYTPMLAALVMMLVVTRDGYHRDGWRSLGLGRLGIRYWPFAILAPIAVGVAALLASYALPSVTPATPDNVIGTVANVAVLIVIATVGWTLGEEFGWRGYLLPRLRELGDAQALVVSSVVWAAWHMPLILFTSLYHADGDRLLVLPLFVGTVVIAGVLIGYLRIASGSIWPATLAHTVHNAAWALTADFMVATSPVAEEYVAGDTGIVILVGTALALWVLITATRRTVERRAAARTLEAAPGTS